MKRFRIRLKGCEDNGDRSAQQDAWGVSAEEHYPKRGLLAVLSDGMGGMEAGERFSRIAVDEMLRAFGESPVEDDACTVLLNSYGAARRKAMELSRVEDLDGGATVVAVLIKDNQCAFLSVGDSRLYLLRNGGLIQLNREQTLGVALDEGAALGYVFKEEAERNIHRASLTNHLCMPEERPCDRNIAPFRLAPGDRIALMSDGVSGSLSEEELTKILSMPGVSGAEAAIAAIKEKKLPRQDNMSILLLAVERVASKKGEKK